MSRKTDRRAVVLNKLQNVVGQSGSNTATGRRLAIERWVKTYITQVEYLKDNELQFLYNIFSDEDCWSGTKLNNVVLGQRLSAEKIGEIKNPFCRYNMACKYCVIDKIYPLFLEQFESYKGTVSPDGVDIDGNPVDDKYIRRDLLDSMKSYDPAFSFWIYEESGTLKEYSNLDGFRKAVHLKWSEGVEYFYNRLKEQEREEEIINAVTTLSNIQCNFNCATILDFCIQKMDDLTKRKLLVKVSQKNQGIYSLLNGLIKWSFLDTVQDIVKRWCHEEASVPADKILSHRDYALLFSALSDVILKNPASGTQAKAIMMNLWRCSIFNEHKKTAVDISNDIFWGIPMKHALAGLIVSWERDDDIASSLVKENEILEILQFAKSVCTHENFMGLKTHLAKSLKTVGRPGMKKDFDYGELAERLFDKMFVSH